MVKGGRRACMDNERETKGDICGREVETTLEEKRGRENEEIPARRGRLSRAESLVRERENEQSRLDPRFPKEKEGRTIAGGTADA